MATKYEHAEPIINKVLQPDGTITTLENLILGGYSSGLEELTSHIESDNLRWQSVTKSIVDLRAELKQFVIDTYAGIVPQYDYSKTVTVITGGSLVNLVEQDTYTVPVNGAIQATVGGLLGAGLQLKVNGETVWTAPLNLLLPLSSDEIPVSAGDIISASGVVGIGQTIDVSYTPNKGAI